MTQQLRAKELFLDAVMRGPSERARFLDDACGSDLPLRQRVEELLDAHESAGRFLDGADRPDARDTAALRDFEAPGTHIGRYKLLQRIGEGGFGEVWMAEQTEPVVRRIALKIIKRGMDTRQVIARFEAERQALAMMDHPNIARVLDAGAMDNGRPYFVMELVRGDPVTQYCDRERLSIPQRLALFRNVCSAVQHAHQKGIIHRDLKPSNVLVTVADGAPLPKVIDFGIAKAIEGRLTDKTLFTEHRALIGTPAYMSPEQAEMSGVDIDTRSDIYALGVLLYELLAGSTPLASDRLRSAPFAEMQRIIREEEPPRPSLRLAAQAASSLHARQQTSVAMTGSATDSSVIEIARKRRTEPPLLSRALRGDLDWIVMKCLEKDRSRRYETSSALGDDISRYLDDQPVRATPPSPGYRLRKFARRNRGTVTAAAAMTLTLLIAAGVSIAFGVGEARQRADAEFARREAETALNRAEKAEGDATARADQLAQVASFQEEQLAGIDAQSMGMRIRDGLLTHARAAAERAALPPDEVDAHLADLDRLIAGTDFTAIAQESLAMNFFQPALNAIERQFADQPLLKARLLQASATTLREIGLLQAAEDPQREALELRHRLAGTDDPDTIDSTKQMGYLLYFQGKLTEAEPYGREALERSRRILGTDHIETLDAMDKLANLLREQGELSEAEVLGREALAGRRRVLGNDHPDTLASLTNLATLFKAQGRLAEAEPYDREALERYRQVLGEEHPHTLIAINNLAVMMQSLGRFPEAEGYYREALEKSTRVRGHDHPDTLTLINNFGMLLQSMGDIAQAERFCRDAVDSRRRVLGDDHPQTLMSISNLGSLLASGGRLAEAEPLTREALESRRRILGEEHPDTLTSLGNLSLLLQRQGKLEEAELRCREALALRRRVLGDDHPHTLNSLNTLGVLLKEKGELDEAEIYAREALDIRRRKLGDDHRETLISMLNLAMLLRAQHKLTEAEPYSREVLEGLRRVLGDGHFLTLNAIGNQGGLLLAQDKPAEALALLLPAESAARTSFTGDNALRLARFLTILARARIATGEFAGAESNLSESHLILQQGPGAGDRDRADVVSGLVELYDAWHAAEPDQGHDRSATEWRGKLADLERNAPLSD